MTYDIGQMVEQKDIVYIIDFINLYGKAAFKDAVFNGAFSECAYAYIHPCDEMEATEGFSDIQRAFINAYC